MSDFVSKPKVFRKPAAKPQGSRRRSSSLFAWGKDNRRNIFVTGGVAMLLVLLLGQSFTVSKVENPQSGKIEEKITFFSPSDSLAAPAGETFVIQGKDERIVGQITQPLAEEGELNSANTASNVDIKANQELLSVVNKH